jgi:predicted TIM-barrel fold metal-dependent hydrolase
MGFIDAHSHVWTQDLAKYPIATEYAPQDMQPPSFTPEELLAHARPCGVDRVVLIQMSYYGCDNSYMCDCIAASPGTFRGVAIIDHTRPDLEDEVQRLHGAGVRGFRVYQRATDPRIALDDASYRPLLGVAGELGMAISPLIDPECLPAAGRAAKAFPATTFAIDHLARIGVGGSIDQAEVAALCDLAQYPNCLVKVSAFYALGAAKAPYDDLQPLIRRVRDAFGADRLMWATDCPYQAIAGTYEASLTLIRDRCAFLTDEERTAVLCGTAERVYFR